MSDKWIVVGYGDAVIDGKPESEWSWCVNRDDDTESIDVESKARAEEIAALMNLPWRDGLSECARVAHDERERSRSLEARNAELEARAEQMPALFERNSVLEEALRHRARTNEEQESERGLLAGYCVRCNTPWPCALEPSLASYETRIDYLERVIREQGGVTLSHDHAQNTASAGKAGEGGAE